THLGFEVKVDVSLDGGDECWVQLSRGTAADLGLESGQQVWVFRTDTPLAAAGLGAGAAPDADESGSPQPILSA
ncbi:MAG TPA: TOBE domain-containing protein, partial [Acidimicrobiales bacterium]|nr:TOBE domain-containing protein [Acidimicrobiales bacterium]